jgi:hypothetical protein
LPLVSDGPLKAALKRQKGEYTTSFARNRYVRRGVSVEFFVSPIRADLFIPVLVRMTPQSFCKTA